MKEATRVITLHITLYLSIFPDLICCCPQDEHWTLKGNETPNLKSVGAQSRPGLPVHDLVQVS